MRVGEHEARVELSIDVLGDLNALKRTETPGLHHLRLESFTGPITKTSPGTVTIPTGQSALCINMLGAMISRTANGKLMLIPPRSIAFFRGGMRLSLQAARGDHSLFLLSWHNPVAPYLDAWVTAQQTERNENGHTRTAACKPIDPQFVDTYRRFEEARKGSMTLIEPLLLSIIYELSSQIMIGSDQIHLAPLPADIPETIRELVEEVRKGPSLPWPLKDAANRAGYSPFHFSRVFKSLVGYGFHEYVDRCRTEVAVEMLCTSDSAVDLVASSCGFGTTQGLRESIKEYLGLVPSELRSVPEHYSSEFSLG